MWSTKIVDAKLLDLLYDNSRSVFRLDYITAELPNFAPIAIKLRLEILGKEGLVIIQRSQQDPTEAFLDLIEHRPAPVVDETKTMYTISAKGVSYVEERRHKRNTLKRTNISLTFSFIALCISVFSVWNTNRINSNQTKDEPPQKISAPALDTLKASQIQQDTSIGD